MDNSQELAAGVWIVSLGQFQAYLVLGPDGWTVIDSGLAGSGALIREAMEAAKPGAPLVRVVLTHGHEDHAGSLSELMSHPGVISVAHRLDAPFIRGDAPMPPPNLTEDERPLYESIQPHIVPAPPAPVVQEVEDGDHLAIGHGAVVVHTPGHTPGSMAIYLARESILFTGDTIAAVGDTPILGPFNCDRAAAMGSFRKLAAIDASLVCFGHGRPLQGAQASAALAKAAALLGH